MSEANAAGTVSAAGAYSRSAEKRSEARCRSTGRCTGKLLAAARMRHASQVRGGAMVGRASGLRRSAARGAEKIAQYLIGAHAEIAVRIRKSAALADGPAEEARAAGAFEVDIR